MDDIRAELSNYPIRTRLQLTGTIIVARDIAHAKLLERIEAGDGLPQYVVIARSLEAGIARGMMEEHARLPPSCSSQMATSFNY